MIISIFLFFKQKTAYEMRISDRSSDGCSSDLERLIVEKAIKDTLVDPDSAKFEIKPLIVGSKLACGRFNSKNRMGGYTGYKAFEVAIVTNGGGTITS